ncbi:NAD(P)-binding protein [Aureobasidium pullulans]|uniref:NAD(P)-binding protein n=1 Tax=Aureobasidium pullulans TaxID=5580 RepID=A0A4S9PCK0_AURPU|nr:NAD(P)-binding protein [Aureobasidium pullulans]THY67547.1 NAD(P)-binding protein [Aureobasidium pullulans]TIA03251.1 NAD(P)-binding protein [Aureobasidium pullulans]
MPTVLVVGATRGLGLELAKQYAERGDTVYGTARSSKPEDAPSNINWIDGIDVAEESAGSKLAKALDGQKLDTVILAAGYFGFETFDELDFEKELLMYKTSAIGPVFVVQKLHKAGLLSKGSKVIIISSESGSIALRHESEGGGNYGHHASKAASNMVGKLLSLDLKEHGVAVGLVHPAFMRTEMTKGVGFDKYWDAGGAVTPDVSAKSVIDFVDTFDISKTGTYWAPRGPGDIGTAEDVLGPKDQLSTPLQLPW